MSSQSFFVLQNKVLVKQKSTNIYILMLQKLRGKDLNQRPPGYEPDELPGCSTPRCLMSDSVFTYLNNVMAEELGFEPRRQFPDLPVFKTGPFNHLGIPPDVR